MKRNKRECLEKATSWLATEDDWDLQYACLELRLCLEALVYEKLDAYKKYVPDTVFEKWQPAHALKMLKQFEPDADASFSVAIAPESSPGVRSGPPRAVGEHKFFTVKWLAKTYNKLGSFLHLQRAGAKSVNAEKLRKDLELIANTIREAIECMIKSFTLAERVHFKCGACGADCIINTEIAHQSEAALCIDANCGAIHHVKEEEGKWAFQLAQANFKCLKCEESNYLAEGTLAVGLRFRCHSCKSEHTICGQQWGYNLSADMAGAS